MSFGLKIVNPTNELVFSSEGKGLYCIGKATLQTLVQPSGSGTAASPGRVSGYSVYRISSAGQVIFAVDLPLNKRVGIKSVTQPSAGIWEITCWCGSGADADNIDTVQYELAVWAYGIPTSAGSTFGMNIYDANSNIAYDLTRTNPLFPRAFVEILTGSVVTIPSLTRAVAMGCSTKSALIVNSIGNNSWRYLGYHGLWQRTSSTSMSEVLACVQRYQFFSVEPSGQSDSYSSPTRSFIIEGNLLPIT